MLVLPHLVIKNYGAEVYGTYQLYISSFQIMFVCATLDLGHSFFHKWTHSEGDKQQIWYDLNKVSYLVFSIMLVCTIIITFLTNLDRVLISAGLIYCFILIFYSNILNYSRYTESIVQHNIMKITQILLLIVIIILFIQKDTGNTSNQIFGNIVIFSLILSYILTTIIFFKKPINFSSLYSSNIDIKSEIKVSSPVFLGGFLENILLNVDKIIIAYLITTSDLSLYSINIALGSIFLLWGKAIDTYILPSIMRSRSAVDNKEKERIVFSVKTTIKYTIIMFMLMVTFISLYADEFITMWIDAEHAGYYHIAIIATCSALLRVLYNIRRHEEYAKYNNWFIFRLNLKVIICAILVISVLVIFLEVNLLLLACSFLLLHFLRLVLISPNKILNIEFENYDYFSIAVFFISMILNATASRYFDLPMLMELLIAGALTFLFGIIHIRRYLQVDYR